jgi:UDP-glucose 4-epimerase
MKKLNILVFGGTGFLGFNLVKALAKEKHHVRVFSRGNIKPLETLKNVNYIVGDISNNADLKEVLKDIDFVFHFASTTNPKIGENDLFFDLSTNLASTINILDKCVENNIKKFIFCSSGGTVYGNHDITPISEDCVCEPISSYGLVKHSIEMYIKYFSKKYDLNYEILRVSNPYGYGQFPDGSQGVIPIFIKNILNNIEIQVFGDGTSVRDYIYIDDFIDLNLKLLTINQKNNTLNIASGKGISINDLIRKIEFQISKTAKIKYLPKRKFDVSKVHLNINKVKQVYNWEPKIDLDNGLKTTLNWMKNFI